MCCYFTKCAKIAQPSVSRKAPIKIKQVLLYSQPCPMMLWIQLWLFGYCRVVVPEDLLSEQSSVFRLDGSVLGKDTS